MASVHRQKRFLPVCGNSCEARGDRVPFELVLFRTASRLSEEVQRHYLVYELDGVALGSFTCSQLRITFLADLASARRP